MKKILVLGAGAMGSAFTVPCAENRNEISLIGTHLEDELVDNLNKNNFLHPALNTHLPKKIKISKFERFDEELKSNPDIIALAISSKGIDWACEQIIKNYSKDHRFVLLTKGLTLMDNKISTISSKINSIFKKKGLSEQNLSSVKGPCLATGLANKIRTSTVIANKNISIAKEISEIVSTDYYRTEISEDIIGVETAGAIKNIYSMLIGASIGLSGEKIKKDIQEKYYHNTASALFKNALAEMKKFIKLMGGKEDTAYGLAGLGDLYVSVAGGRNSMMGKYLGQGHLYLDIKEQFMKNITVEGADLALEIGPKILKDFNSNDFPIMFSLVKSICENKKLEINW